MNGFHPLESGVTPNDSYLILVWLPMAAVMGPMAACMQRGIRSLHEPASRSCEDSNVRAQPTPRLNPQAQPCLPAG